MNHSEADIALVEKYFDAELNDAELKTFTTRLESDENFKLLVEQEKALIAAVRYEGAAANLQFLEDLESKLQKETPIRLSSPPLNGIIMRQQPSSELLLWWQYLGIRSKKTRISFSRLTLLRTLICSSLPFVATSPLIRKEQRPFRLMSKVTIKKPQHFSPIF